MKKIIVITGSPRKTATTSALPHRTWRLSCQNTPKIRTAHVWVLGAILPLVLLVFYGEFLRIPLEFRCAWEVVSTRKSLSFFVSDFPKTAKTLGFFPSSRFFHLLSNSAEFGNPGHTRNAVGRLQTGARVQISSSPPS